MTRLVMSRYMLANIVLAVVSKQTNKTYLAHVAPSVIQKCVKTGNFHGAPELAWSFQRLMMDWKNVKRKYSRKYWSQMYNLICSTNHWFEQKKIETHSDSCSDEDDCSGRL